MYHISFAEDCKIVFVIANSVDLDEMLFPAFIFGKYEHFVKSTAV